MLNTDSKALLPASDRPLYLSLPTSRGALLGLLLLALTLLRAVLAAYLPPSETELNSWLDSKALRTGLSHGPPLTGYLIRATAWGFGDSIWSFRLPALALGLAVWLGLFWSSPRTRLIWAVVFTPIALLATAMLSPDLLLVLFWIGYLVWLGRINTLLDGWSHDPITRVYHNSSVPMLLWIAGGMLLGFGLLSHYRMGLAVPCALVVLASRTQLRAWGVGFLLHLAVALTLCLPLLLSQWGMGFEPFFSYWSATRTPSWSFSHAAHYWWGQIQALGALPLIAFPWVILRYRDFCADPKLHVYFWFFVLSTLHFAYFSLAYSMGPGSAAVAYVALWPLADRLLSWSSFRGVTRTFVAFAFAVPWAVTFYFLLFFLRPSDPLPKGQEFIARWSAQWESALQLEAFVRQAGIDEPLVFEDPKWVAYARFLKLSGTPLGPNAQRLCSRATALIVNSSSEPTAGLACFSQHQHLGSIPVVVAGKNATRLWLTRYFHE